MGLAAALKKTPLHACHAAMGARLVDFAGWDMPLQYGKVLEEHQAVREAAGLFDISHMGLVGVTAPRLEEATTFLNGLVPQDLARLVPGKAVYTQFLNEQGGILDDLIVYRLPQEGCFPEFSQWLVVCNAANTGADIDWMRRHAPPGVDITLVSGAYALLALQGPQFAAVLDAVSVSAQALPARFYLAPAECVLDGRPVPVLLSRTGYTGEDGVEIVVRAADAECLWRGLLEAGRPQGLVPVGLAARDTLRLEAAYPLHGHDIDPQTTPLEAGLGWSVCWDAENPFIGRDALERQRDRGLARKIQCFKLGRKTIPRQHDALLKDGREVGSVTSGSVSPTLQEPIGMGYVRADAVQGPGDTLQVVVRGTPVDAEIVRRPFYKSPAL